MKRVYLVKSEICDVYTRIFRTRREKHNLIKFSPFYRESFLCHSEESNGDPAGYCVPVGKRNKQAKDKQLSLATIVWSKVKFMTRDVAIPRKGYLIKLKSVC